MFREVLNLTKQTYPLPDNMELGKNSGKMVRIKWFPAASSFIFCIYYRHCTLYEYYCPSD